MNCSLRPAGPTQNQAAAAKRQKNLVRRANSTNPEFKREVLSEKSNKIKKIFSLTLPLPRAGKSLNSSAGLTR